MTPETTKMTTDTKRLTLTKETLMPLGLVIVVSGVIRRPL